MFKWWHWWQQRWWQQHYISQDDNIKQPLMCLKVWQRILAPPAFEAPAHLSLVDDTFYNCLRLISIKNVPRTQSSCGCCARFSKVPCTMFTPSQWWWHWRQHWWWWPSCSCSPPYNRLVAGNWEEKRNEEESEKLVKRHRTTHPRVLHCAVLRALGFTFFKETSLFGVKLR